MTRSLFPVMNGRLGDASGAIGVRWHRRSTPDRRENCGVLGGGARAGRGGCPDSVKRTVRGPRRRELRSAGKLSFARCSVCPVWDPPAGHPPPCLVGCVPYLPKRVQLAVGSAPRSASSSWSGAAEKTMDAVTPTTNQRHRKLAHRSASPPIQHDREGAQHRGKSAKNEKKTQREQGGRARHETARDRDRRRRGAGPGPPPSQGASRSSLAWSSCVGPLGELGHAPRVAKSSMRLADVLVAVAPGLARRRSAGRRRPSSYRADQVSDLLRRADRHPAGQPIPARAASPRATCRLSGRPRGGRTRSSERFCLNSSHTLVCARAVVAEDVVVGEGVAEEVAAVDAPCR